VPYILSFGDARYLLGVVQQQGVRHRIARIAESLAHGLFGTLGMKNAEATKSRLGFWL
jgi:hypothetical protein